MLNFIWMALMLTSIVFGVINGSLPEVVKSVTDNAKFAFELCLGLAGIMALWLGLMKIAEDAGLVQVLARILRPLMVKLFPEVPAEHPAMGAMIMNLAANMLGLANAATPLGLKAMGYLADLNEIPGVASNSMCTLLALNTSSIQLIPVTAIAYLAANGATRPSDIVLSALLATSCSTAAAIISVKLLARLTWFKPRAIEGVI